MAGHVHRTCVLGGRSLVSAVASTGRPPLCLTTLSEGFALEGASSMARSSQMAASGYR